MSKEDSAIALRGIEPQNFQSTVPCVLKILLIGKGETLKERDRTDLLIYSPNASGNSILVSYIGGRDSTTYAINCCLPRQVLQEAISRTGAGTPP